MAEERPQLDVSQLFPDGEEGGVATETEPLPPEPEQQLPETPAPETTPEPPESPLPTETTTLPNDQQTAEVVDPTIAEQVSSLGFENVADDAEAQARLLAGYEQIQQANSDLEARLAQANQYAPMASQYMTMMQDPAYQNFVSNAQQPIQQQQQQQQQPEHWWAPPQYDEDLAKRYLSRDEEGNVKWNDDAPLEVRAKADAAAAYYQSHENELVRSPDKFIEKVLNYEIPRRLNDWWQSVQYQQQEQAAQQNDVDFVNRVAAENSDWLYAMDPRTQQPQVNPQTNAYVLSPQGQLVDTIAREFRQKGMGPQDAWNDAIKRAHYEIMVAEQTVQNPEEAASQANDRLKNEHTARARGGANRLPSNAGSLQNPTDPPAAMPQNPKQRPGESLLQNAQAMGIQLS